MWMTVQRHILITCLILITLGGCTTHPTHPNDHLEPINRKIFKFNKAIDTAVIKPVALTYQRVVPEPIDYGVTNFFSNLDDIRVIANDLLQLKFRRAGSDGVRFFMNSTLGLFGLLDLGTTFGFPKHYEDFGQTLGYWGVGTGSYLVLPFLGPSTIRDTGSMVVDATFDPRTYASSNDVKTRNIIIGTTALSLVDLRADLLDAEEVFGEAAIDEYAYIRDAFLQRREYLTRDGNVPTVKSDELDNLFDDLNTSPTNETSKKIESSSSQ